MNLLFCFPIPKEVRKKKEKQHFCNYQELSGTIRNSDDHNILVQNLGKKFSKLGKKVYLIKHSTHSLI